MRLLVRPRAVPDPAAQHHCEDHLKNLNETKIFLKKDAFLFNKHLQITLKCGLDFKFEIICLAKVFLV